MRKLKNIIKLPFEYLYGLFQWMYPDICPRCYAQFGFTRFGWQTNRYFLCSDCRKETGNELVINPSYSFDSTSRANGEM